MQKARPAKTCESSHGCLEALDTDRHLEPTQSSEDALPAAQGCLLVRQDVSWIGEMLESSTLFSSMGEGATNFGQEGKISMFCASQM